MSKQQELLERIQTEFQPHFVTVENESHMHSSGRGADSHFKLVIVSDADRKSTRLNSSHP